MLQRNDALNALAALLDGDADRPLTEAERALLRVALAELAGAQATIARQAALLASFEYDIGAIETGVSATLDHLRALVGDDADAPSYDFTAAKNARAELLRRLHDAAQGRDVLEAILRFVAAAARIVI